QLHPGNTALGGGGPVSQHNDSEAESSAGNRNSTNQGASQQAGGVLSAPVVQAIGQPAGNGQAALSGALSLQCCATNLAAVKGGGGPVSQHNDSKAESSAGNGNALAQGASQAFGRLIEAVRS